MFATQGQQLPWEVCAHRNPQDPQRCSKNQGLGHNVTTFLLPKMTVHTVHTVHIRQTFCIFLCLISLLIQVTFNVDSNGILEVTAEATVGRLQSTAEGLWTLSACRT